MAPAFTIVIPHRDDLRGLAHSLAALPEPGGDTPSFEVVVVDNCSVTGRAAAEKLAASHSLPIRVVEESLPGAGPARNRGAAAARGDTLVFLDCDCAPAPGWLGHLAEGLKHHDVVGGPVVVQIRTRDPHAATAAELFDLLYGFDSRRSFERDGLLLSSNLCVSRAVFERVGPFRAGLSEDREWCVRAAKLGFDLMLWTEASVRHAAVDDEAVLHRRWARVTRESFAFHRVEGRSRGRWFGYCTVVGLSPAIHWLRIVSDNRLSGTSTIRRSAVLRLLISVRARRVALGLRLLIERRQPLLGVGP